MFAGRVELLSSDNDREVNAVRAPPHVNGDVEDHHPDLKGGLAARWPTSVCIVVRQPIALVIVVVCCTPTKRSWTKRGKRIRTRKRIVSPAGLRSLAYLKQNVQTPGCMLSGRHSTSDNLDPVPRRQPLDIRAVRGRSGWTRKMSYLL